MNGCITVFIRAALARVEELERVWAEVHRRATLNGVAVWNWMSRAEAAEAKVAEEYERGYQDGRESTLDNPHVLAAEK